MKVVFYLGPGGTHLNDRKLVIRRMPRAGDDTYPSTSYNNDSIANTTTTVSVDLADNQIYQAVQTDRDEKLNQSVPQVLNFHTGSLSFPGPAAEDRLSILAMYYDSSSLSSQSTSSSSPSSTSLSSQSSQSTSSSSPSSASSQSTSSSSQSTSSSSTSESSTSLTSTSASSGSSASTSSTSRSSSSSQSTSSSSSSASSSQSTSSSSQSTSSSSNSSSSW